MCLWLPTCLLILSACKAIPDSPQVQQSIGVQHGEDGPTLTVTSLDNSIPIGDAFPILVELDNLPPNQQIDLELANLGITPSVNEASVMSDDFGHAELRLNGRASKPQLDGLNVRAFFEGGTVANLLLVNFEPPQEGELQAQATTVGEPTTEAEYIASLPTVTSLEELKADNDPPPAYKVDGVRFPEEDGSLGEPVNLLEYNTGKQAGDGVVSAQAVGCSSGNTFVYARTLIDGATVSMPAGTKVFISGDAPDQTRYVGANGKLCFTFTSGKRLDFRAQGWTTTGIYLHSGADFYRLVSWLRTWLAPSGGTLTASNVLGDEMRLARTSSDGYYRGLRVFYKINRVYDWERSTPGSPYTTFPLSVVYPDTAIWTTRAGYGRMFIDEGDFDYDPTLFHEFGHEVYYRRMLGADSYRYWHQRAVERGETAMPGCVGSIGWDIWKHVDGCAGMLEGFALWFDGVTTRAGIGANYVRSQRLQFDPEPFDPANNANRPTGGAVPGRVAQFLWDITDAHAGVSSYVRDVDADEVINKDADLKGRYSGVARYFKNAAPNDSTFTYMYKNRIQTVFPADQRDEHCAVVRRNTLAVTGMCD